MVSLTLEELTNIFTRSLRWITPGDLTGVPIAALCDAGTTYEMGPLWAVTAATVLSVLAHTAMAASSPPQKLTGVMLGEEVVESGRGEVPEVAIDAMSRLVEQWCVRVPGVEGLLEPMFEVLEDAHGVELVADLMSLIICSDTGLPEPVVMTMLTSNAGQDAVDDVDFGYEGEEEYGKDNMDNGMLDLGETDLQFAGNGNSAELMPNLERRHTTVVELGVGLGGTLVSGEAFGHVHSPAPLPARRARSMGEKHVERVLQSRRRRPGVIREGGTMHVCGGAFGRSDVAAFTPDDDSKSQCEFRRWVRLKTALGPLLQPMDEGDPSAIRLWSRTVRGALRERYMSDGDGEATWVGPAVVHRRIAMHLIDEAAGVWNAEIGVVFRTYEQLDEQPLTLETLPRHLSKV